MAKMSNREFNPLVHSIQQRITDTLISKESEYATGGDRLWNFNERARMNNSTPGGVCWGDLSKHLASIQKAVVGDGKYDWCWRREDGSEGFQQRFIDAINYLILLYACIEAEAAEAHQEICEDEKKRLDYERQRERDLIVGAVGPEVADEWEQKAKAGGEALARQREEEQIELYEDCDDYRTEKMHLAFVTESRKNLCKRHGCGHLEEKLARCHRLTPPIPLIGITDCSIWNEPLEYDCPHDECLMVVGFYNYPVRESVKKYECQACGAHLYYEEGNPEPIILDKPEEE